MRLHFPTSPAAHFARVAPLPRLLLAPRRIWGRIPRPPPPHCRTCCKRPLCFSPLEVVRNGSTAARAKGITAAFAAQAPLCKSEMGKLAGHLHGGARVLY